MFPSISNVPTRVPGSHSAAAASASAPRPARSLGGSSAGSVAAGSSAGLRRRRAPRRRAPRRCRGGLLDGGLLLRGAGLTRLGCLVGGRARLEHRKRQQRERERQRDAQEGPPPPPRCTGTGTTVELAGHVPPTEPVWSATCVQSFRRWTDRRRCTKATDVAEMNLPLHRVPQGGSPEKSVLVAPPSLGCDSVTRCRSLFQRVVLAPKPHQRSSSRAAQSPHPGWPARPCCPLRTGNACEIRLLGVKGAGTGSVDLRETVHLGSEGWPERPIAVGRPAERDRVSAGVDQSSRRSRGRRRSPQARRC